MKQYEADQQRKLFQWTTFIRAKYPEIDLMFHIPNGLQTLMNKATLSLYVMGAMRQAKKY